VSYAAANSLVFRRVKPNRCFAEGVASHKQVWYISKHRKSELSILVPTIHILMWKLEKVWKI